MVPVPKRKTTKGFRLKEKTINRMKWVVEHFPDEYYYQTEVLEDAVDVFFHLKEEEYERKQNVKKD